MGQKVRFAPSTNSWGGKLHDDVSDLIHILCTAQWVKKSEIVSKGPDLLAHGLGVPGRFLDK